MLVRAAESERTQDDDGSADTEIVQIVTPVPRDKWLAVHAADPHALATQGPAWMDAQCERGGRSDASRLYRTADGGEHVLPLVRRGLPWAPTSTLASMPLAWGFGGLISTQRARPGLITAVLDDVAGLGALRTHLRPNPLQADAWSDAVAGRPPTGTVVIPRVAHILSLEGGYDRVSAELFNATTRRNLRAAARAGVRVECDTTGRQIPVFYRLLMASFDRWAGQQHEPRLLARARGNLRDPEEKFRRMASHLDGGFRLWIAWHRQRPVAAILVLQGTNAHYTRGAMDKALAGPCHANSILHAAAIEDACVSGCDWYHMGETGTSPGLTQFKTRFGAVAHPYAELRLERLPLTAIERAARSVVKRVVGFKEPSPA